MTSDQDEESEGRVLLSRPRDESLEAYKEWISELYRHITGMDMTPEKDMSEEAWREQHAEFWRKIKAASDEE